MEDKSIIVSVLFKDSKESTAAKRKMELNAFAKQSGIKIVSSAKKTACLSMSLRVFEKLFDHAPDVIEEQPPNERDFGAPAGFSSGELPIPKELHDYVELLTVEPPASRLATSAQLATIPSLSSGVQHHGKKKDNETKSRKKKGESHQEKDIDS